MENSLKSINDIAVLLNVEVSTIYSWVHTRRIPYYKLGRLIKFSPKDIERWLQEKKVMER